MAGCLDDDIERVIVDAQQIRDTVTRLGAEISRDYADKNLLVVSVLRGAFVFTADLMRAISVPCSVDFMVVSSYGVGSTSSGTVKIVKDVDEIVEGRHVLFAEDVVDTGLTLSHLVQLFKSRHAASVEVCAFAVKDVEGRAAPLDPKYVGIHVPDEFIVGYGLDYAERYRNLPYVGALKREIYAND